MYDSTTPETNPWLIVAMLTKSNTSHYQPPPHIFFSTETPYAILIITPTLQRYQQQCAEYSFWQTSQTSPIRQSTLGMHSRHNNICKQQQPRTKQNCTSPTTYWLHSPDDNTPSSTNHKHCTPSHHEETPAEKWYSYRREVMIKTMCSSCRQQIRHFVVLVQCPPRPHYPHTSHNTRHHRVPSTNPLIRAIREQRIPQLGKFRWWKPCRLFSTLLYPSHHHTQHQHNSLSQHAHQIWCYINANHAAFCTDWDGKAWGPQQLQSRSFCLHNNI